MSPTDWPIRSRLILEVLAFSLPGQWIKHLLDICKIAKMHVFTMYHHVGNKEAGTRSRGLPFFE